jgi:para-nitrobenzyl esterase
VPCGLVVVMVTTTSGSVIGVAEGAVRRYLGIPYARAPFGALRFAAPVPPEPSPRAADAFGPTAASPVGAAGGLPDVPEPVIPGDDILNLNVWTAAAPEERRPVLVWIHGGGFFGGCSANPWYDGTSFARDGLVFVSLNYRLGAEGFADLPGATRNRAVLDWVAALEWVRDNIAGFGGDPDQVTVFGQSAGGMAVTTLMTSPRASGLFHRAIICSGVADSIALPEADALAHGRALTEVLGRDATTTSADELVRAQVETEAQLGLDMSVEGLAAGRTGLAWSPEIDGDLVPRQPLDAIVDGVGRDIPVLIGTTHDEFAWRYYLEDPDDPRGQELADALFRRPTQRFVDARAGGAPTYRYEFQWESTAYDGAVRAGHSLDIPFFFDTLDAPYFALYAGREAPQELADRIHGAFARFALVGDPGWPAYHGSQAVQLFDDESTVVTGFVVD